MVDKLLQAHSPGTEIAASLDMHPNTFYRKVEEEFKVSFSEYSAQKKNKGKGNLRLAQLTSALKGNATLQIWLGKNWLAQRDEPKEDKEFDGQLSVLLEKLQKIQNPEEFQEEDAQEEE